MICGVCLTNEAVWDPYYGWLPCISCQDRQGKLKKPGREVELVGEEIKAGRKEHWHDVHGAHNKGEASSEFRDKYGVKAMKRQGFTDKEIKNAKPVWNDDKYYKEGN